MKNENYIIGFKIGFSSCVLMLALIYTNVGKAQEKITLQQAIELTLQKNLQVKQAQLAEALSQETLLESKWALYPNLSSSNNNLTFNYGRSIDPMTNEFVNNKLTGSNLGVTSNVILFQGFLKLNQISQNKYLLESDKSNTQKVKNDLILKVLTTYLQVLSNQDLLLAAQEQLDISHQKMDKEQKFFDVGNKTLADLSQVKSQLASAELNFTDAKNQLDLSFLTLAQLLERDPVFSFKVENPSLENEKIENTSYSPADVYYTALGNSAEIKQAEYRKLALLKGIEVAKASYYPRLLLQGNLSSIYSDRPSVQVVNGAIVNSATPFFKQLKDNFNQSVGFGLTIPIFDGFSVRSAVRRAKVKYEDARVSEQIAKNNLNKIINQAVLDLRGAEKKYTSCQAAYKASKDAFNTTDKRYDVGLANALDYKQAQTDLNKAHFEAIKAKYDLIFRRKIIDFYLGKCLVANGCN